MSSQSHNSMAQLSPYHRSKQLLSHGWVIPRRRYQAIRAQARVPGLSSTGPASASGSAVTGATVLLFPRQPLPVPSSSSVPRVQQASRFPQCQGRVWEDPVSEEQAVKTTPGGSHHWHDGHLQQADPPRGGVRAAVRQGSCAVRGQQRRGATQAQDRELSSHRGAFRCCRSGNAMGPHKVTFPVKRGIEKNAQTRLNTHLNAFAFFHIPPFHQEGHIFSFWVKLIIRFLFFERP